MQRAWLVSSTYKGCLEEPEVFLKKRNAEEAYQKAKKDHYGDVILVVIRLGNFDDRAECVVVKKHCSDQ